MNAAHYRCAPRNRFHSSALSSFLPSVHSLLYISHNIWTYINSVFPDRISWVSAGLHLPILLWKLLIWALFPHSCPSGSMWISAVKFCLVLPWIFLSRMEPWLLCCLKVSGPGPYCKISDSYCKVSSCLWPKKQSDVNLSQTVLLMN